MSIKNILSRCLTWVEGRVTPTSCPLPLMLNMCDIEDEITHTCMLGKIDIATATNFSWQYISKKYRTFQGVMHIIVPNGVPRLDLSCCGSLEESKLKIEKRIEDFFRLIDVDKITQLPVTIVWEDDTRYLTSKGFVGKLNEIPIATCTPHPDGNRWLPNPYLRRALPKGPWGGIMPSVDEAKFSAESTINEWFAEAGLLL